MTTSKLSLSDSSSPRTTLRGTIPGSLLKQAVYLLKSLCPEPSTRGDFRDYDRVYTPHPDLRSPANTIRLREHFATPGASNSSPTYTLFHFSLPDRRTPPPLEKRTITSISVSREARELLPILGCTLSFEYVRKGVRYETNDNLVCELYVVEKVERGETRGSKPLMAEDKDETGEERYGVLEVSCAAGDEEKLNRFAVCLESVFTIPKGRI